MIDTNLVVYSLNNFKKLERVLEFGLYVDFIKNLFGQGLKTGVWP